MNYSPKFNHIFIKLINKICNQNTPLNTSFNWFNKYKVTLQSGTNDFVSVYVENPNINYLPKCIASFSIDFLTKKQKAGVRHSLLEAQLPSRQCFHVIFKKSSLSSESPIPS